jgi:hypothetical protein
VACRSTWLVKTAPSQALRPSWQYFSRRFAGSASGPDRQKAIGCDENGVASFALIRHHRANGRPVRQVELRHPLGN